MPDAFGARLLDALLDSWERNNTILLNLVRVLPEGGLAARATADSPSVSEMLTHLHHERMISVFENAPEFAGAVPEKEWVSESDPERIALMLIESAQRVRDAVKARIEAGQDLELDFAHPVLLIQLLIFHEGYHHGQIKLALKLSGQAVTDEEAGPITWAVWRQK
ncbi:MAG: damage-inducible protein DinB [Acidobacteria bacterium]|nr:damage-inducible protein DinB [Acidobacteriota bacterium]